MDHYEQKAYLELQLWERELHQKPPSWNRLATRIQQRINQHIPQKVHDTLTATIKQLVQAVLFGATHSSNLRGIEQERSLLHREALVRDKIDTYSKTAAAEGGITGAGGFLMSLADFPILMGIKLKLLFELATIYGFDVKDYRERLYILYIFQLAFSSKAQRLHVYHKILHWDQQLMVLPGDPSHFDWYTFQQEYRDYIDLAKLAQLLPVVGAAVGTIANYRLLKTLGKTAMMCYRLRLLKK